MSRLKLENLFADDENLDPTALPDYTTLHFVSNGSHIYGEIMWPSSNIEKPHPCVIMLHGFPGTARNDDISHALCRIGCVVIVPHNRGAWGSEGKYTITHCIEKPRSIPVFPTTKTKVCPLVAHQSTKKTCVLPCTKQFRKHVSLKKITITFIT